MAHYKVSNLPMNINNDSNSTEIECNTSHFGIMFVQKEIYFP